MTGGRYVRTDTAASTADAILLTTDSLPDVLLFLGADGFAWEPAAGVLSVQTRRGTVLNIRTGSYVVRDAAGHVSHIPADAFAEAFKPAATDAPDEPAPAVPGPDTVTPGEVAVGIESADL